MDLRFKSFKSFCSVQFYQYSAPTNDSTSLHCWPGFRLARWFAYVVLLHIKMFVVANLKLSFLQILFVIYLIHVLQVITEVQELCWVGPECDCLSHWLNSMEASGQWQWEVNVSFYHICTAINFLMQVSTGASRGRRRCLIWCYSWLNMRNSMVRIVEEWQEGPRQTELPQVTISEQSEELNALLIQTASQMSELLFYGLGMTGIKCLWKLQTDWLMLLPFRCFTVHLFCEKELTV